MIAEDRKVILILGGGTMQVPALRCAREKGWTVIMADGNPEPEGKPLAHHFEHVDLRDAEGMIAMAERYRRTIGLDGVFTAGTDFSLTVAKVAEHLGLPGIDVDTAQNATYKDRMRRRFREAGVPSPAFRTAQTPEGLEALLDGLDGPWVVKPVDNMGARGTRRVDRFEDLEEAMENSLSWSGSHRVIIEEYMEGPEYSLDAVVEHGKVTLCGLADRHIYFPPYFIEMGHTMPAVLSEKDAREILKVFEMGIRALGIRNGTAKGDLKLTSRGGMIGEIAARLSGGYMSGWTFPYSSGVNVTEAAMHIALGLPAGDLSPRYSRHSAERAFISIPGVVESLSGLSEVRKQPGVRDVFVRVRPGDRVNFPRNNVEKCGNIISCADTRQEAVDAAEKALSQIAIRLLPGVDETGRYLYGTPEPGMPDAWSPGAALEATLKEMSFSDQGPGGSAGDLPAVIPLPGLDALDSRDWHGLTPAEGLERIRRSGVLSTIGGSLDRLGRPFWKAFFRGGAEGGLWALRTFAKDPRGFLENVRVWSER